MRIKALIILSLLINLFQYNYWHLWNNLWYHMDYLNYTVLYIIILSLSKDKWVRFFVWIGIIFNINDVVDIFFNPYTFKYFEIVFVTICTIYAFLRIKPYARQI